MSEADLVNILEGEEDAKQNEESDKDDEESQASDEEISTRELPSSQSAFKNLAEEEVSPEG